MKKEMKEEYLLPRCKFCGKQMIADTTLQSDKEAEEYAVMHCDCELARDYQEQVKKGTRERGKQKENQRCGQRLCSVLRKEAVCIRSRCRNVA